MGPHMPTRMVPGGALTKGKKAGGTHRRTPTPLLSPAACAHKIFERGLLKVHVTSCMEGLGGAPCCHLVWRLLLHVRCLPSSSSSFPYLQISAPGPAAARPPGR